MAERNSYNQVSRPEDPMMWTFGKAEIAPGLASFRMQGTFALRGKPNRD
jgi:hypothetical protein